MLSMSLCKSKANQNKCILANVCVSSSDSTNFLIDCQLYFQELCISNATKSNLACKVLYHLKFKQTLPFYIQSILRYIMTWYLKSKMVVLGLLYMYILFCFTIHKGPVLFRLRSYLEK